MQILLAPDKKCGIFSPAKNAWRYLIPFSSAILSSKNGLKICSVGVAASSIKGQFGKRFDPENLTFTEKKAKIVYKQKMGHDPYWCKELQGDV